MSAKEILKVKLGVMKWVVTNEKLIREFRKKAIR